jgi:hypothetical protein
MRPVVLRSAQFNRYFAPGVAVLSIALAGCATRGSLDEETLGVCVDQLPTADGWVRVSGRDADARSLDRRYPAPRSRDILGRTYTETPLWFRNSALTQLGSCSKESCGVDDCYWLVRIFVREEGRWVEFGEHSAVIYYSQ